MYNTNISSNTSHNYQSSTNYVTHPTDTPHQQNAHKQQQQQQQQRSSLYRANRPSDLTINNHQTHDYSPNNGYYQSQPSPYYQNYSPLPNSANSCYNSNSTKTPSYTTTNNNNNNNNPKVTHTPTYSPMYNTSAHMIKSQSYFNFDIPQQQQQQRVAPSPHYQQQQNFFPTQQQQCFAQPTTPKYHIKSPSIQQQQQQQQQQNDFNFTSQSNVVVVDMNNNYSHAANLVDSIENEEIDVSAIDSTLDQNIDIDIATVDIASTGPPSTLSNGDYLTDHPVQVNTPPQPTLVQSSFANTPSVESKKIIKTQHTNSKTLGDSHANSTQKCMECGKLFTNKSALAKHRLTHSTERKYSCHLCQKSFKRQDHLNGHMLTHQDKKPFQCKVPNCEKSYCDSRSLKRHIEGQHQDFLAALANGNIDALSYLPRIGKLKANLGPNMHQTIVIENNNNKHNDNNSNSQATSRFQDALNDCLNDKKEKEMNAKSQYSPITPIQQPILKKEAIVNNVQDTAAATTASLGAQKNFFTFEEPKPETCKICGKGFKNIPALNGHMRLHGGYTRPKVQTSAVTTKHQDDVNKTQSTSCSSSNTQNELFENIFKHTQQTISLPFEPYSTSTTKQHSSTLELNQHPKQKPKPKPLQIPSTISALHTYPNKTLLKSPHINFENKNQYTPPPMLSPFRRAPGLYFTAYNPSNSAFTIPYLNKPLNIPKIGNTSASAFNTIQQQQNLHRDECVPKPSLLRAHISSATSQASGFFTEDIELTNNNHNNNEIKQKPHINVGYEFQALIPKLLDKSEKNNEKSREDLMWDEQNLEKIVSNETFENYLDITCKSSCVYGSSNNLELSLHILNLFNGDTKQSLKAIIDGEIELMDDHPMRSYNYQETSLWTSDEIKKFEELILKHDKNFLEISKNLPTKSLKECVEFYYLWKKIMCDSIKKKWKTLKRKRKQETSMDFDADKICSQINNESHNEKENYVICSSTLITNDNDDTNTTASTSDITETTSKCNDSSTEENYQESLENTKKIRLQCSKCNLIFKTHQKLEIHMNNKHGCSMEV